MRFTVSFGVDQDDSAALLAEADKIKKIEKEIAEARLNKMKAHERLL